jgi:hypothetical protein
LGETSLLHRRRQALPDTEDGLLETLLLVLSAEISINGVTMLVEVVTGPLCKGDWRGTIYVGCDVQVMGWEETPLFLKDCDLSIQPGTVVYVAYHNDAAYYNGCSCHTGELP